MPAAEVRILDAIGSMPPDKSLTLLQLSGRSIHAAVSALTGPNASHTIKELEVRCLSAEDMNALWSLLSIPTLERFTVDGHPTDVLSGPQIVVVQDTLQTRMHEGLPPLQTGPLGMRAIWQRCCSGYVPLSSRSRPQPSSPHGDGA